MRYNEETDKRCLRLGKEKNPEEARREVSNKERPRVDACDRLMGNGLDHQPVD